MGWLLDRNVFLGLAQDKLNNNDDAEKAYLAAIRAKDNDRTAWQGLINLYEKQGENKLDAYRNAAIKLALLFGEEYGYELVPNVKRNVADLGLEMTSNGASML